MATIDRSWSVAQRRKFARTMKEKAKARKAAKRAGNGNGSSIPLDMIPKRASNPAPRKRDPRQSQPSELAARIELATGLVRLVESILKH